MDFGRRESGLDESQPHCGLFDSLAEIALVEGESEIAVLKHVVGARLVVASAGCLSFQVDALSSARGRDLGAESIMPAGELLRCSPPFPERRFAQCTACFTGGEFQRRVALLTMEKKPPLRLRGLDSVEVLGQRVPAATDICSRLLGLAFLSRDSSGVGLFIPQCRSIHTFGMRFALDIHFVDDEGREVRRFLSVPGGRVVFSPDAAGVLELPSTSPLALAPRNRGENPIRP